ncbi:MAG: M14 family zinc carboxypeptidase [Chloroflexota bacterium]
MADKKWNRKTLRNIGITLANRFNYEELRNLTSDLGIDYGDLEGTIQDSKARGLVKFMYRRGRMEELIEVGKMSRTDIDWDALIVPMSPEDEEEETFTEEDFDFTRDDAEEEQTTPNIPLSNTLAPNQIKTDVWWQNRTNQLIGGGAGIFLLVLITLFGFGSGNNSDPGPESSTIGRTENGQFISATRYGRGDEAIIFIGGIHSGKSPGSVEVSRELDTYLTARINSIPNNLVFYVIEDLNPDSLTNIGRDAGRLNSNGIDPNRNSDCNFRPGSTSGDSAFSELESQAFRQFINGKDVVAAVFWSARETNGGVYPAFCLVKHNPSQDLARTVAIANGYSAKRVEELRAGTGELADWLADQGIATVTVLMRDHNDADWARNQRVVDELINEFGD